MKVREMKMEVDDLIQDDAMKFNEDTGLHISSRVSRRIINKFRGLTDILGMVGEEHLYNLFRDLDKYVDVVDHKELKAVMPQDPDVIRSYVVCCEGWHFEKLRMFFSLFSEELVKKLGG